MSAPPPHRRPGLVLLVGSALVLGGAIVLLARDPRSRTAWGVAAGALANLMVAVILRHARNAG